MDTTNGTKFGREGPEDCSNKAWNNKALRQDMWFSVVYAVTSGLFNIFLLYVGYRVYCIVKFNDKLTLLMIFFLNLEVLSLVLFFTKGALQDY